jgi:sugar/nucleoside kinase (ribokinase family)
MARGSDNIKLTGTGCCLVDEIFNGIDFNAPQLVPYRSKKAGDGGLTPGQLVFAEEFEQFSGKDIHEILKSVTGGREPDVTNVGGPSIVALIHCAQMLQGTGNAVHFHGVTGNDQEGLFLEESLSRTPVQVASWKRSGKRTASTIVLSDPDYDDGHGERMFINTIGAAGDLYPEDLGDDFFNADITVYGGTALVPNIHDHLTALLGRSKDRGAVTVVNTVYDFRNQKADPDGRWPLGGDEAYPLIDLLVTDYEEALRLSGSRSLDAATAFFKSMGVPALVVTNGSKDVTGYAYGPLFERTGNFAMSVSTSIVNDLKGYKSGDTTGCGDNFVGGVLAAMVKQMQRGDRQLNLREACSWGIVSGGFACFYMGGTYYEKELGEKLKKMEPYLKAYKQDQMHA